MALHGMLGEASDWDFLGGGVEAGDLWDWSGGFDRIRLDPDVGVVIGYSMGGRLALHALDQVSAAVIVSAHTGLQDGHARRLESDLRWAAKARSMEWGAFLREWHAQPIFARGGFEPDRSDLEPRREAIAAAFDRWSLGRQADLLPGLRNVEIPVLWINGGADESFTKLGEAACAALPRGEHVVLDGCGHRVPWEAPQRFSELIMQFLSRHSLCR